MINGLNKIIPRLVLCAGLASPLWASQIVPSTDIIDHGVMRLDGQMYYSKIKVNRTQTESKMPFVTRVEMGLFGNSQVALHYSDGLGIEFRSRLLPQEGLVPNFVFGVRSILGSQEAAIYSIPDSSADKWKTDVYATASYTFKDAGIYLGGGLSYLPQLDYSDPMPFWEFRKELGLGFTFAYEGFNRLDYTHHLIKFLWKPHKVLTLHAGMNEVQDWFYQDEVVGFYTSPEKIRPDTYRAPALTFGITLQGRLTEHTPVTLNQKIVSLKAKLKESQVEQERTQMRLSRIEQLLATIAGPQVAFQEDEKNQTVLILDKIVKEHQKPKYNISVIRQLQDSLLQIGAPAFEALEQLAMHTGTSVEYRENVIRIMGYSKHKRFTGVLLSNLDSKESIIRREALLALSNIGDLSAREKIRALLKDEDELIAAIAVEVLKELEAKAKELEKPLEASPVEAPKPKDLEKEASEADAKSEKTKVEIVPVEADPEAGP